MKTRRDVRLKSLRKSRRPDKKWDAVFEYPNGRTRTVSFGASGMSDYTKHKDKSRKQRYIHRHKSREDWKDPTSPGALSRWLLWNKTTFGASFKDYLRRFHLAYGK